MRVLSRAATRASQALFASIGGEISSAVAISALLGQLTPQQVLEDAAARFRSVTASGAIADLQRPFRLEHYETRAASLGAVDAFVSHSWWDDPASKVRAATPFCFEKAELLRLGFKKACCRYECADWRTAAVARARAGSRSVRSALSSGLGAHP
jgi:hypothetical protein